MIAPDTTRSNPSPRQQRGYQAPELKLHAAGRWCEIIETLAGIDPDLLDGRHHACPRCGGRDRFRYFRDGSGGAICTHCHRRKNGDGLSTIQWLTGWTFAEVCQAVGDYLHLGTARPAAYTPPASQPTPARSERRDPLERLRLWDWGSPLYDRWLAEWCELKGGITPAAVRAIGGQLGTWSTGRDLVPVVAIPAYGPEGTAAPAVKWTVYHRHGQQLPTGWQESSPGAGDWRPTAWAKSVCLGAGEQGIHGQVDRLHDPSVTEVWKLEGPTDVLAAIGLEPPPGVAIITTANGCGEAPSGWLAGLLRGRRVRVLHDADAPGQDAARDTWIPALVGGAAEVRNVQLPYQIAESSGLDLRDWSREHTREWGELEALARGAKVEELPPGGGGYSGYPIPKDAMGNPLGHPSEGETESSQTPGRHPGGADYHATHPGITRPDWTHTPCRCRRARRKQERPGGDGGADFRVVGWACRSHQCATCGPVRRAEMADWYGRLMLPQFGGLGGWHMADTADQRLVDRIRRRLQNRRQAIRRKWPADLSDDERGQLATTLPQYVILQYHADDESGPRWLVITTHAGPDVSPMTESQGVDTYGRTTLGAARIIRHDSSPEVRMPPLAREGGTSDWSPSPRADRYEGCASPHQVMEVLSQAADTMPGPPEAPRPAAAKTEKPEFEKSNTATRISDLPEWRRNVIYFAVARGELPPAWLSPVEVPGWRDADALPGYGPRGIGASADDPRMQCGSRWDWQPWVHGPTGYSTRTCRGSCRCQQTLPTACDTVQADREEWLQSQEVLAEQWLQVQEALAEL